MKEPERIGRPPSPLKGRRQSPEHVAKRREAMMKTIASMRSTCVHCAQEFTPRKANQQYCSAACWNAKHKPHLPPPPADVENLTRAERRRLTLSQMVRECAECGDQYSPTSTNQKYCSGQCQAAVGRRAVARTPRVARRKEEYAALVAIYGNACGICGTGPHEQKSYGKGRLPVDHCHTTGKIRGLLCHRCNTTLGLMRDDTELLRAAIDYLDRSRT